MEKRTISNSCDPVPRFRIFTIFLIAFLLIIPSVIFDTPFELIGISSANTPPVIDNVTVSSYYAPNGYKIYIHVNATDNEDPEYNLTIDRIEWRENNSENQTPPSDVWHTDSTKISINEDEGYSPSGYIRASMTPTVNAARTRYDIRVRVMDQEEDTSQWGYLYDAFIVLSPPFPIEDITLQELDVFRGDTIFITVNASHIFFNESELTIEIQYSKIGGNWTDLTVTPEMYNTTNGGYWKIPFSPGLDWPDIQLGDYAFRGRVRNGFGAYSNGGVYVHLPDIVDVKNNEPYADSLSSEDNIVERGRSIVLFANGEDIELSEEDLEVNVEYSADGGITWNDHYITDKEYKRSDSRWEIEFSPDSNAELGTYDFRVRFSDGLDHSDWLINHGLVTVTNAIPVINSLEIPNSRVTRLESTLYYIDVEDKDQNFRSLTPNFYYRGPNDEYWVSGNQDGYLGTPSILGTRWAVSFVPPSDADLGLYSFKLEFIDETGNSSEPLILDNILTVENSEPQVNIVNPWRRRVDYPIITFEAEAFDEEDSELFYLWDFGDGSTSTEPSPTYVYQSSGEYVVTVTVTDQDGGTGSDIFEISRLGGFTIDSDHDGLTDLEEFDLGTDIENPDTDSDGILDGQDFYPLDPTRWRSPLQESLIAFFSVLIILTITIVFITNRRLKKKGKKEAEK
jgi:hypothetical protein